MQLSILHSSSSHIKTKIDIQHIPTKTILRIRVAPYWVPYCCSFQAWVFICKNNLGMGKLSHELRSARPISPLPLPLSEVLQYKTHPGSQTIKLQITYSDQSPICLAAAIQLHLWFFVWLQLLNWMILSFRWKFKQNMVISINHCGFQGYCLQRHL